MPLHQMKINTELRDQALEVALETVKDNLKCLVELTEVFNDLNPDDRNSDANMMARLIAFGGTAIEKLLMLNLYSRNPIFLLNDSKITKAELLSDEGYKRFDVDWLYKNSFSFIDPKEMWDVLEKESPLSGFKAEFFYIKDARNKYLHVFIKCGS